MIRLYMIPLCLLTSLLTAQTGNRMTLNRFPFIPEPSATPPEPLLNTQFYLSQLDPIPAFNFPEELPIEFHQDEDFRKVAGLYRQASDALQNKDTQRAVALMSEAVSLKPDEELLKIMYADSLLSNGQYMEAKELYNAILESFPTQYQCLNNLAWMLATVQDPEIYNPERALRLSTRARLVNPQSHFVWSTLSEAQFQLGHYREAEQSMAVAIELANASGASIETLVSYLFKRDRYTLARESTSILE